MSAVPFTFGIALTPRSVARDWKLIEALLGLTLASVLGQSDGDFRVLIVGHDRPALPDDRRISFEAADWPVEPPGPHNDDSGQKKHLINARVLAEGGGLLMLLDADDWVDVRLVETARRLIGEGEVGGLIETGVAVDLRTLHAAPLPHPAIFDGGFHRLCGSSTVARLRPGDSDPVRRDPFETLRSHHRWSEAAAEHGVALARLPLSGAYLINTGENHSDLQGPHLDWRRGFIGAVNAIGAPITAAQARAFGLELDAVRAVSALARARARAAG